MRDPKDLRNGTCEMDRGVGDRAPRRRQTGRRRRHRKDLRTGGWAPNVRVGARAAGDQVRSPECLWQDMGPVGAREQRRGKGRLELWERSEGTKV